MKSLKCVVSLCVAAVLLVSLFAGCGIGQNKLAEVAGTWTMLENEDEEYILDVLAFFELYEEEIALVDTTSMQLVRVVEFHEDKTYSFRYDGEASKETVRSYLDSVFQTLYEKREQLDALYEESFALYSQEAFEQFYADLYECADYAELLDVMVEEVYDYETLDEPYETGTFSIIGDKIYCTMTGETEAAYLEYQVSDTTLKLVYEDGEEVYQKAA